MRWVGKDPGVGVGMEVGVGVPRARDWYRQNLTAENSVTIIV